MISRRRFLTSLGGGLAAGASLGGYAVAVEPRFRLIVKEWDLPTPKWTHARPLRIVALADIHACEPWMPRRRIEAIVRRANRLRGDIIVLLGDFAVGLPRLKMRALAPREWAPALAGLRAPLGVHAVPGNHDWWDDLDGVLDGLAAAGVQVYRNRAVKLGGPTPFWLSGTDSMLARRAPGGGFAGAHDLPATLAQIDDYDPAVLMAHEPDLFVDVPQRFAVTLSGHTHGGQVRLPFVGRPVVPSSYGQRFAYGHVREGGRDLVISAGLGCSIVPVRFGVPPEITVVTLRRPAAASA